jgi:uncharacterized protein (DUF1330 family)
MAAYVVVDIEVQNREQYERYKARVNPSIEMYGGRYLVRGGRVETVEGSWAPQRFVIVEFADVDRAKAWWSSDEYAELKALRQASARTHMIVVEGVAS